MANLPIVWTKHLKTKEEKENFESLLRNSTIVASRLVTILREMDESKVSRETDYDSPSWAYLQADQNGYRRAIQEVLKLFNYLEK